MRRAAAAARAAALSAAPAAPWCLPPAACVAAGGSAAAAPPPWRCGASQLRAKHGGGGGGSGGSSEWGESGGSGGAAAAAAASLASRLPLMDAIHLRGLLFHGYHGVLPEETALGQKFLVDATLYCGPAGLAPAGASDDLRDSINYAAVYEDVRGIMEGPPRRLLEAAAADIAGRVLAREPRVAALRVHVRKPHVALRGPLESVGIEIFRAREE